MNSTIGWRTWYRAAGQASSRTCRSYWPAAQQWTRVHAGQTNVGLSPARRYATGAPRLAPREAKKGRRTGLIVLGGFVVVGAIGVAVSDDANYVWKAAQRTSRVLGALAININDYRRTLSTKDTLSNDDYDAMLKACHKRCADRTLTVLEKNGSIFIKLGQHLSSMTYLLPLEWCDTFIPLQDKCPVSDFQSIRDMFLADTGRPLEDLFASFEERPIGAASLAQVHIATLRESGEKVAVKVQHPALDEWANLDLALTRFTFRTLKRFFPEYDLTWLSDEMDDSLPKELDFALEGTNAERAREYFSHVKGIPLIIPKVVWAKRRILVMEYVTGRRPDDLAYLDANNIDRDEVSAALARIFNEMIFGNNAPLHCDPHGGNIAVRLNPSRRAPHNFDIILYDHGLYRVPDMALRRSYAKLWLAVIANDEPLMRRYSKDVAGISDAQFPLFASAITGRDYVSATRRIDAPRSDADKHAEKDRISGALTEGMLEQLVQLLGQVPRVMLLILKTNDLTRSLDENLHTRQGPVRTFLILARYAARCVYEEKIERLVGGPLWPRNVWGRLSAWTAFAAVEAKLTAYEFWLGVKRSLGLDVGVVATGPVRA